MNSLPIELVLHICRYLDTNTEHKLKSIMNCENICCNHEHKMTKYLSYECREMLNNQDNLLKYEIRELEEEIELLYEKPYHCDLCGYYSCYECNEYSDIYFDKCYYCNVSFCTDCDDCTMLKSVFIDICKNDNCYYCSRGGCFNTRIENVCTDCTTKLKIDYLVYNNE